MNKIFNFFRLIFSLHKISWWVLKKSEQKQIKPIEVIAENKDIGLNAELIRRPGLIQPNNKIYGLDFTTQKKSLEASFSRKTIEYFKGLDFSLKRAIKCTDLTDPKRLPRKFKLSLIPEKYAGFAFRMGVQNYIISADDSLDPKRSGHLASGGFKAVRIGGRILE